MPALPTPVKVPPRNKGLLGPVNEKTTTIRVCAVTGIFNPVTIAFLEVPKERAVGKVGSVTVAF